ncbi:MAG: hypothetical protein ACYCYP_13410 [Leptospirales bacterium]
MDSKIVESTEKKRPPNAGKGRKKGVPNKITKSVREAIETAFEEVGSHKYLVDQALENPSAFMALLGKLLPSGSAINIGVAIGTDGRRSFEDTIRDSTTIRGGLAGVDDRISQRIGELYLQWQKGEPLPEEIVLGGLPDDLFTPIEALTV